MSYNSYYGYGYSSLSTSSDVANKAVKAAGTAYIITLVLSIVIPVVVSCCILITVLCCLRHHKACCWKKDKDHSKHSTPVYPVHN